MVVDLIQERERTHGPFCDTAAIAQELKAIMHACPAWNGLALDPAQREALDMIASKMARILSGNCNEPDHWQDIAGYAALGERAIPQ